MTKPPTIAALVLIFATVPLAAQMIPPTHTMQDAARAVMELRSALEPAIQQARDEAAVLGILSVAHGKLYDTQTISAMDNALRVIDDFIERRNNGDKRLPRELFLQLQRVTRMIRQIKNGPPVSDLTELRQRIHWGEIHPLQRVVTNEMTTMKRVVDNLAGIERMLEQVGSECVAAIERSAEETRP